MRWSQNDLGLYPVIDSVDHFPKPIRLFHEDVKEDEFGERDRDDGIDNGKQD